MSEGRDRIVYKVDSSVEVKSYPRNQIYFNMSVAYAPPNSGTFACLENN